VSAVSETTDPIALREQIAQRINLGLLPIAADDKIFGGYGHDQACACCDSLIGESEVLYEIELAVQQPPLILSMHRECFNVWMEESESRQSARHSARHSG
jgi:hypothetical protein